ncbi:MAG: protein kinase, partial [Anaerolineales bacterium]|nr:protein kinase [Anaerolineales bacterium]
IECRPSGCVIADMRSPNGIYVNNVRVRRKRLFAGDTIYIGTVRLRFEEALPEVRPDNIGAETQVVAHNDDGSGGDADAETTATIVDPFSYGDTVVDPTAVSASANSLANIAKGGHIGRYQIKANFGRRDAMIVYRAYDPQLARDVALKVLAPEYRTDDDRLRRIQREIQLIGQLEHPHITQVYDSGLYGTQPYVVMPFFEGGTLAGRMAGKKMTLKELAPMVNQLTSALDAAHAQGVVHGQITPYNILFDQENRAYLTDFGVATISEASHFLDAPLAEHVWASYMSPEQADDLLDDTKKRRCAPRPISSRWGSCCTKPSRGACRLKATRCAPRPRPFCTPLCSPSPNSALNFPILITCSSKNC